MTEMNQITPQEAASQARNLLTDLWKYDRSINRHPCSTFDFLRQAPERIVEETLQYSLDRPYEIRITENVYGSTNLEFHAGGVMDRNKKVIKIAALNALDVQRFTLAHEIGHCVLHKGTKYFRDLALVGDKLDSLSRPQVEKEADWFAAELLMPSKLTSEAFITFFKGKITVNTKDSRFPSLFSPQTFKGKSLQQIQRLRLRDWSRILATATFFDGRILNPLTSVFGVSPSAMAIKLEQLGLVTN